MFKEVNLQFLIESDKKTSIDECINNLKKTLNKTDDMILNEKLDSVKITPKSINIIKE